MQEVATPKKTQNKLNKTKITTIQVVKKSWLKKALKSNSEFVEMNKLENSKLSKFEYKRIGEGEGFLGNIYMLSTFWTNKSDETSKEIESNVNSFSQISQKINLNFTLTENQKEKRIEIVLKMTSQGFDKGMIKRVFVPEILFFSIAKKLLKNSFKYIPKVFFSNYTKESALLLMEYISSDQKVCFEDGLTDAQVEASLASLAAFHSDTISNTKKCEIEGVGKGFKNLVKAFREQVSGISKYSLLIPKEKIEFLCTLQGELKQKCKQLKNSTLFCASHGDLWSSNLLFRNSSEDQSLKAFLIDFQFVFWASPVIDLLTLICSSVSSEGRNRKEEHWIKNVYFPLLSSFLQKSRRTSQVDLGTAEEFFHFYQSNKFYGLSFCVASLPLFLSNDKQKQAKMFDRFLSIIE